MLIHCFAGVSRSTASAYIAVCQLSPHRDEREIALALRAASPTASAQSALRSARRRTARPPGPHGRRDRGDRAWAGMSGRDPVRDGALEVMADPAALYSATSGQT